METRPQTSPRLAAANANLGLARLDLAAFALALIFLLSGLFTLGNYGISWDEGLGNMFFGNRYAQYLLGFDEKYLDFATILPEEQAGMLQLEQYTPFRDRAHEFPGLIDTLSASFMRVFAYQLGLADPVDAFHSFTIVLAAIALLLQYYYVTRLASRPVAFISMLLVATYPRFWGDMHFNPKDVPEAVLFGLAVLSFAVWANKPSWSAAVAPGIFTGLALGVKANALFIPVVLVAWLMLWLVHGRQGWQNLAGLLRNWQHVPMMGLLATLTYWASWPLLYTRPGMARLYFEYIFSQGGRSAKGEWSFQPLRMLVSASPEIFLLLLALGMGAAVVALARRDANARWYGLLLVWMAIPIARISAPMSVNFDGVRHYLEFLPAAAILAAAGSWQVVMWLRSRHELLFTAATAFLITYFFVNITQAHSFYHPYQYIYFNQISGGSAGARQVFKQSEVTDYWAVSYRQGLEWLNANAPQGTMLNVAVGDYLVEIPAANWLRPDITLVSASQLADLQAKGKKVYLMHITRPSFYKGAAKACVGTQPVYQKYVAGISVLQVHDLARCPADAAQ